MLPLCFKELLIRVRWSAKVPYLSGIGLKGVRPTLQDRDDALHICAILKWAQRPHCRANLQQNCTDGMLPKLVS